MEVCWTEFELAAEVVPPACCSRCFPRGRQVSTFRCVSFCHFDLSEMFAFAKEASLGFSRCCSPVDRGEAGSTFTAYLSGVSFSRSDKMEV